VSDRTDSWFASLPILIGRDPDAIVAGARGI